MLSALCLADVALVLHYIAPYCNSYCNRISLSFHWSSEVDFCDLLIEQYALPTMQSSFRDAAAAGRPAPPVTER